MGVVEMTLAEMVRSIVLAFDRGDSRRDDIRYLADMVQNLQYCARQHLEATREASPETWAKLQATLEASDNLAWPP